MELQFLRGSQADREGIAQTLAEAFFHYFKPLGFSPEKVRDFLVPALHPERFFVAKDEAGRVLGCMGIASQAGYPLTISREETLQYMGRFKGSIAYKILRDEVERPVTFGPGEGYVDWVGVRPEAQGQGIASRLIAAAMAQAGHDYYSLDVVQGNEQVLPLYEKLGFKLLRHEKEKNGWMKGFKFRYLLSTKEGVQTAASRAGKL